MSSSQNLVSGVSVRPGSFLGSGPHASTSTFTYIQQSLGGYYGCRPLRQPRAAPHSRLRAMGLSSGFSTGSQAGPSAVAFSGLLRALSSSACGEARRRAGLEQAYVGTNKRREQLAVCLRQPLHRFQVLFSRSPAAAHLVHVAVLAAQRRVELVVGDAKRVDLRRRAGGGGAGWVLKWAACWCDTAMAGMGGHKVTNMST